MSFVDSLVAPCLCVFSGLFLRWGVRGKSLMTRDVGALRNLQGVPEPATKCVSEAIAASHFNEA